MALRSLFLSEQEPKTGGGGGGGWLSAIYDVPDSHFLCFITAIYNEDVAMRGKTSISKNKIYR